MGCNHPAAYIYNVTERSYQCVFCAWAAQNKQIEGLRCLLETDQGPNTFLWVEELARQRMEELAGLRAENARLKAGAHMEELATLREENARLRAGIQVAELVSLKEENTHLKASVQKAVGMLRDLGGLR